jgi:hypothetical protein
MKFAFDCEQKFLSLSLYMSTEGDDGKDEPISGVGFDPAELNERIISFLSLLSLRARWLVDLAAEKAGLQMRHSTEEIDRLRKQAFKFAHEIDAADEKRWD